MSSAKTIVFGSDGQVASALRSRFSDAVFVNRHECDFEKDNEILRCLDRHQPRIVINPAAYTQVDQAESERESARAINAVAPATIARWCGDHNADLVHFSTDYVYPGTGEKFWSEEDEAKPVNFYGETKLEGERAIQASGCRHLIFRTSWVFGRKSRNFMAAMMKAGRERESVRVVCDQYGCPTYADDLAIATAQILASERFGEISGVFNLVNSGWTSRYDLASAIFRIMRECKYQLAVKEVIPVPSSEFKTAARRPLNCKLKTDKVRETFGINLRPWEQALSDLLGQVGVYE